MPAAFGGFCPLPIPLGGNDIEGWRSSQHARLASDLAACARTHPFARLTFTRGSGTASPSITNYLGRPAKVDDNLPTISGDAADPSVTPITITWPAVMTDDSGNKRQVRLTGVKISINNSLNLARVSFTANQIVITPKAVGVFSACLTVHAKWGDFRIERYGGDPDKTDSKTEETPYAWIHYQDQVAAVGSAYGKQRYGLVHAKRLAYARALAAASRADDRLRANSTPGTADVKLDDWAKCLRVSNSGDEPRWRLRRRCAAIFASKGGGNLVDLDATIREFIGDEFIEVQTFNGQDHGIWPNHYAMAGQVWATVRSRIIVAVNPPRDKNDQEFRKLIQVELMELLDRLCPGHVVFDWTTVNETGFLLGISQLGIDSL